MRDQRERETLVLSELGWLLAVQGGWSEGDMDECREERMVEGRNGWKDGGMEDGGRKEGMEGCREERMVEGMNR